MAAVRPDRSLGVSRLALVLNRPSKQVLSIFVDHYNTHRPHRTLRLTPPTQCVEQLSIGEWRQPVRFAA